MLNIKLLGRVMFLKFFFILVFMFLFLGLYIKNKYYGLEGIICLRYGYLEWKKKKFLWGK